MEKYQTYRAVVRGGKLELEGPVDFPDGAVLVTVFTPSPEPEPLGPPEPISQEEFQKLLAEGMWADRADMADNAEWVRRIRGDNTNRTGWSR